MLYINGILSFSCDQSYIWDLIVYWQQYTILQFNTAVKHSQFWKKFNSHKEALQQSRCQDSKTSFNPQLSHGKKYNMANTIVLKFYLGPGLILELKEGFLGALQLLVFLFYYLVMSKLPFPF